MSGSIGSLFGGRRVRRFAQWPLPLLAVAAGATLHLAPIARADVVPLPLEFSCNATAAVPWTAAGEGYRAQASTQGVDCAGAELSLALVAPTGRAVWERAFGDTAAVRVLYGVPDAAAMETELQAWLTQGPGKPATSADLPAWPPGEAAPAGFDPETAIARDAYEALRTAARPVFCFAEAPGFQTCVLLEPDDRVIPLGRRATR